MAGAILVAIMFILVVWAICSSSGGSSNAPVKKSGTGRNTGNHYARASYSECPSCGAPGYDGYCEECGYPDINQGWLGENY